MRPRFFRFAIKWKSPPDRKLKDDMSSFRRPVFKYLLNRGEVKPSASRNRRIDARTNAFSKKAANYMHALSIYFTVALVNKREAAQEADGRAPTLR